jgi:hypothetical protein
MAIEFRCSQCGKLLRTGDDTVGRQAQCPACGALTKIPGSAAMAGEPLPVAPLGSESSLPSGSPFAAGAQAGGASGPENAYQSSGVYRVPPGQPDPFAAQRVSGPATALTVMAAICLVLHVFGILFSTLFGIVRLGVGPHGRDMVPIVLGSGHHVAFGIVGLVMSGLILLGATRMKRLENYSLAVTVSILAMIPCTSPCCLLGLPFGI